MRRGLLLGAALGIANTAVVVALGWLFQPPAAFGFYSYSPMPRRYSDYLPARQLNGWTAVAVVAGALIVTNMLVVAAYIGVQRFKRRRPAPATSAGAA